MEKQTGLSASPADHGAFWRTALKAVLLWVILDTAVVSLCLRRDLSGAGSVLILGVQNAFLCLMAAELAFVLFVWPLCHRTEPMAPVSGLLYELCLLLLLSAPIVILARRISDTPVLAAVAAHVLLLFVAAPVLSLHALGKALGRRWLHHYYFAALLLSGLPPLLYYLRLELQDTPSPRFAVLSPFWAMYLCCRDSTGSAGQPAAVLAILLGAISLGLLLIARRRAGVATDSEHSLPPT